MIGFIYLCAIYFFLWNNNMILFITTWNFMLANLQFMVFYRNCVQVSIGELESPKRAAGVNIKKIKTKKEYAQHEDEIAPMLKS